MSHQPAFHLGAEKINGKLQLDNERRYRNLVARLKDGRYVISVEAELQQRSLKVNAYLHAVPFPILAAHFGCSVPEVKRDLMGTCWGWKRSPVTGLEVPVREHTAELSQEDAIFFIDWLLPWALTDHGVDIPPPDPLWMFNKKDAA